MLFWLKHIVLTIVLLAVAGYLLFGTGPIISKKTTENAAAKGLSQFYSAIRNSANQLSQAEKYVLSIKKPTTSLNKALKERTHIVEPSPVKWRGQSKGRRFKKGDTLKNVLSTMAKKEGIEFLWYLDKDYVIKHNFRVDNTFISTLYQVGQAIDSDFEYDVKTYFCHKQRAAVITEKPTEFVRDNCIKATL